MKQIYRAVFLGIAVSALAGCSSFDANGPTSGAQAPIVNGKSTTQTNAIGTQSGFSGQSIAGQNGSQGVGPGGMPTIVHFGFDSYSIKGTSEAVAKQNSDYLLQHPDVHVMITGNTDPRGSQEYNFHLGQRRADALKKYMLSQGVPAGQLCTLSYGELRPAATPAQYGGNWRKAYQMDRRAEVVYGKTCQGQGVTEGKNA